MVTGRADNTKSGLFLSHVLPRAVSVVLFVVILVVGLFVYQDYGISIDEPMQRTHSLVNFRYINQVLWHRDLSPLRDLPEIQDYDFNFYNMASQLPLVSIEGLYDFTLDSRTIYLMRHLYTFIIYYISLICFYLICILLFKNTWYAILGTAMLWLYPRFFAESFYNIKDLVFVSFYIMALFFMLKVLVGKNRILWCICFAFTCALAVNTRIMGVMLLAMICACMLLRDITIWLRQKRTAQADVHRNSRSGIAALLPYAIVLVGTTLFSILLTPASWRDPFDYFTSTFLRFSDYDLWNNTVVFAGRLLTSSELPWYYIPVWMGITIPIVYLLLFLVGNIALAARTCRSRTSCHPDLYLVWPVALLFLVAIAVMIIFRVKIYNAWRHVYFLLVPLLLLAIYGLRSFVDDFLTASRLKYIPIILVAGSLLYQAGWIIANHPYQFVYFNALGRPQADRFDRDYWRVATTDLYRYILDNYHPKNALVYCPIGHFTELLEVSQKQRLQIIGAKEVQEDGQRPDFILELYRNVVGNSVVFDGYTEVYTIWVDGFKLASVFVDSKFPPPAN